MNMYNSQDIGFVQSQHIGQSMQRKDIPMGSVFKFNNSPSRHGMENIYVALGNLPSSMDSQCPRVSFMLKPEIKEDVSKFMAENTHADAGTSGAMLEAFATFSISYKRENEECTILGGFQFGWHSEEIPTVRNLGTELGRYISFINDKIDPDDPNSESNLYLSLGASQDFTTKMKSAVISSSTPNEFFRTKDSCKVQTDTPVLLMKVTDKNRASAYEFIIKSHRTVCVTRGIATLKVMK